MVVVTYTLAHHLNHSATEGWIVYKLLILVFYNHSQPLPYICCTYCPLESLNMFVVFIPVCTSQTYMRPFRMLSIYPGFIQSPIVCQIVNVHSL